ncbi:MAG: hypothetical protein LLG04_16685 [Parachlamydia sp.]|nr:hypothetical protein [Parachlamydia sp.]
MIKKIGLLTFLQLCALIPFSHAVKLEFPSNNPVTCIVSQKWFAQGSLDGDPISEQCSSQLEFELVLSPVREYKRHVSLKLTRLMFDVQTNSGVSAIYDSNSPEKTVPTDLTQMLDKRRLLSIQMSYSFYPGLSFVFEESIDPLKKFLEYVKNQFEQARFDQHQDILRASKGLWFLNPTNFRNTLSDMLYTPESNIKAASHHAMDLHPRLFTKIFAADYGNTAATWFWQNNYFTQDLILFITQITSDEIVGSWAGETSFKIKDPSGYILSENSTKNGTISWNRKNALLQNRSFIWEGDFQSDMENTPAKIHFSFDETIQTQPR